MSTATQLAEPGGALAGTTRQGRPAPQEVIAAAHAGTKLPGACTACVVQLDTTTSTLYAANVGDSGFLIIRGGELAIQSPSMQHYFDCPFQLCNQVRLAG